MNWLASDLCQVIDAALRETNRSVQSSADGGSTHVDFVKYVFYPLQSGHFVVQTFTESMELLTERHGNSILQLRTSHFDHIAELIPLLMKSADELTQLCDELCIQKEDGDVQRCWIGVIGRLSAVDMVVRIAMLVFALMKAHKLQRAVCNYFVRGHISGGSSS